MTADEVEPLVVELVVAAEPAHAFEVWTRRCSTWWPASHTVSGDPATIEFEPAAGGRIVERGPDGAEHLWGEVTTWAPPGLLRYRWHLFFDPREATDVEVTFRAVDGGTVVRLEQSGWEGLGAAGPARRDRTGVAWRELTDRFRQALSP